MERVGLVSRGMTPSPAGASPLLTAGRSCTAPNPLPNGSKRVCGEVLFGVDLPRYKRGDVVLASVSAPVRNAREDETLASATELGSCKQMRRKTR